MKIGKAFYDKWIFMRRITKSDYKMFHISDMLMLHGAFRLPDEIFVYTIKPKNM